MKTSRWLAAIAAASLVAAAAWAADSATPSGPVEKSIQARENLPIEDIIQRAKTAQAGEVTEVELEHEHGRVLYEVNIVADNGDRKELKFDARTGELISNEVDEEDEDD